MTRKSLLLLALLASACSNGPNPDQQRIAVLEQENAQLREDLQQAKTNVAKLHSVLARGDSNEGVSADAPDGPADPQGIDPQPENNVSEASAGIE